MPEKIVLCYSGDEAGRNIAKKLGLPGKTVETEKEILYLEKPGQKADLCIVASRHSSESGIPVLTTHSPGNYGAAEYGGNPRELGTAPAQHLRQALTSLQKEKKRKNLAYEVCFEATHHGPTSFDMPVIFMEVGSGKEQWNDEKACEAVASAIEELLNNEPDDAPTAIGFGGGHYCRKLSEVTEYAIGHICPKYNLHNLDSEMIEQMIEKTKPAPETALIEWKGLGKEKKKVLSLLKETNLEEVRI